MIPIEVLTQSPRKVTLHLLRRTLIQSGIEQSTMKQPDTDSITEGSQPLTHTPESAPLGRFVALWLVSFGFWLWAGIQLGHLISDIWL
jgi:hypothetical protein